MKNPLRIAIASTLIVCAATVTGAAERPIFDFPEAVVGTRVEATVARDLDQDGHLDLVSASSVDNEIAVLRGRGDATFEDARRWPTGEYPTAIDAVDLNGDLRLDLITANRGSNDVSILLADTEGGFMPERRVPVGERPQDAALIDLDADGYLDLVTANSVSGDISVLRGNGDGTFEAGRRIAIEPASGFRVHGPHSIAAADFDGDGDIDLAVGVLGASDVSILSNSGDGSFEEAWRPPNSDRLRTGKIAAADVDGDGRPELLVSSSRLIVRFFGADGTSEVRESEGYFGSRIARDCNGDGHVDLTGIRGDVLLGNGDGTFRALPPVLWPIYSEIAAMEDFDGDGLVDFAVARPASGAISVRRGNGDGSYATRTRTAVGDQPWDVAIADFDRDGRPDVLVLESESSTLSLLPGKGDGTFGERISSDLDSPGWFLAATDLNRDGLSDAVVIHDDGQLSVLVGLGDGTFSATERRQLRPVALIPAIEDLDRDGNPDLIVQGEVENEISILPGQGDGTFGAPRGFPAGDRPISVAVEDFNGDTVQDLVVANIDSQDISILIGDGAGGYLAMDRIPLPGRPAGIVAGDLNADGQADLAVGTLDSRAPLHVVYGKGDGTFGAPRPHTVGAQPLFLIMTDLDGNGRQDVVTLNWESDDVSVLLQDKDGTLRQEQRHWSGWAGFGFTSGDLDLDGFPDLVIANFDDRITVLINQSRPAIQVRPGLTRTSRAPRGRVR